MIVDVKCTKCGQTFVADIGDRSVSQVQEDFEASTASQCLASNHFELDGAGKYWVVLKDTLREGAATPEGVWIVQMKERYGEIWNTDEMTAKFRTISFAYGAAFVEDRATGEKLSLEFGQSPEGKRYYYRLR